MLPSTEYVTCTPGRTPKAATGRPTASRPAARYLAWLAEHTDYALSDIEAEVAAHATARPAEPAGEAEPGPGADQQEPDSADDAAHQDQADASEGAGEGDSTASAETD